jgi:hypothetical protein
VRPGSTDDRVHYRLFGCALCLGLAGFIRRRDDPVENVGQWQEHGPQREPVVGYHQRGQLPAYLRLAGVGDDVASALRLRIVGA